MARIRFNNAALVLATLIPILLVPSCESKKSQPEIHSEATAVSQKLGRAIYFWKTRFDLNEAELSFLKTYSITKMYVRMFDVDLDISPAAGPEKVIPVATTAFVSQKPDSVEIAPTVFITTRAIKGAAAEEGGMAALAGKIVLRVKNMMDYNELGPFSELQLDCDWTASTRDDFFALCRQVKTLLKTEGKAVSSTVRLHQLRQDPPPVDKGVLMIYNTGALRAAGSRNSILDIDDVKTYINGNVNTYRLDLDFAYPTFGWGVWFRGNEYKGLLHRTDYSDKGLYSTLPDGTYTVEKDHVLEGHQLVKGDLIRPENSDAGAIALAMRTATPWNQPQEAYCKHK